MTSEPVPMLQRMGQQPGHDRDDSRHLRAPRSTASVMIAECRQERLVAYAKAAASVGQPLQVRQEQIRRTAAIPGRASRR